MLNVRLDADTENRLNALARKTGRAKSYYVREAIAEHLEDMEDRYLAEQILSQPSGRVWTLEEIEKKYGFDSSQYDPEEE